METLFGVSMTTIMWVVLGATLLVLAVVALFAWRNPIVVRLALRNIPRRRAQTVLIVFGLMLATLLITAAFGTGDTMTYSMRQAFAGALGGTDLVVQRINPVVAVSGPPDFNRPVPTFDQAMLEELKAKVGQDERIDGWSAQLQQLGPVINATTSQVSGQTFITGIGPDLRETVGELTVQSGAVFDVASLQEGEMLIDQAAADKLLAEVGHTLRVVIGGRPHELTVRDIVQNSSPSSQFPVVFMRLDQLQEILGAPGQVSEINISLKGGPLDGIRYSEEVAEKLRGLVDTTRYEVSQAKKEALETADLIGNVFTTLFVSIAMFSVAAGILLIFLIFTMLAAERKSEMGMARAVGMQRGHLTQAFIFEGLAYDLGAAAVGAALGVALGFAMVGVISGLIGSYGFRLIPHVEVRSIVVAYCLGMLITFLTVAVSAARVSRLNIVSAIRDIPDMPKPERKLMDQLVYPFDQLGAGQPMGCIGGLFSLVGSLFKSGPVTGTLGLMMFVAGWALANGFLFHLGASLTIIAIALTLRWILGRAGMRHATRDRIAFTFAGLALLAYWVLPIDTLHYWIGAPKFGEGGVTDLLFVGGLMAILGAVWAVMYNADILLRVLTLLVGWVGRMRPVIKTAVAYPMSSIFRTGMAVAMFGLIIFVLIIISVIVKVNEQVDPNKPEVSGGFHIQATVPFLSPIEDLPSRVEANPALKGKFESISGQTMLPVQVRQPDAKPPAMPFSEEQLRNNPGLSEGWFFYNTRLVDDTFLRDNQFQMMMRARGYETDREVWAAVERDPNLVVVDYLPLAIGEAGGNTGFGNPFFYMTGANLSNPVMDPLGIEVRAPGVPGAQPKKLTVVGVLNRFAGFYPGVYVSKEVATQVFPAPAIPTTNYFFRAAPGEDVQHLRRELGAAFLENGLEPVVIADELQRSQAVGRGIFNLLQGFLALGLLVGVAALGVLSTRAVVERRHQIGVLRAIGYGRSMVAASFLLESSFIALLGIFIGVALGLVLSYNLIEFSRQDTPSLQFDVPWLQIVGIIALSYIVSLITTILPARQAARTYPAEALRYE